MRLTRASEGTRARSALSDKRRRVQLWNYSEPFEDRQDDRCRSECSARDVADKIRQAAEEIAHTRRKRVEESHRLPLSERAFSRQVYDLLAV